MRSSPSGTNPLVKVATVAFIVPSTDPLRNVRKFEWESEGTGLFGMTCRSALGSFVRKAVSVKHHVVERKHEIVFGGSKEPLVLVIEPDAAVHGGEVEQPAVGSFPEKKNGEACRLLSGNRITARSSERMTSPAPFRKMALSSLSCWASGTNHCCKNRRVSSVYSSQIFTDSSRAHSLLLGPGHNKPS
jgi:hypothetical protein